MNLIHGRIPSVGGGAQRVGLEVDDVMDLWYLKQMIAEGDRVSARTTRKVKLSDGDTTTGVVLKHLVLEINVTSVSYEMDDPELRISGTVLTDCKDVSLGQHHTLSIGIHDSLRITKLEWTYDARRLLIDAIKTGCCEVGAVLLEDSGANIYLLRNELAKHCSKVAGKAIKSNQFNASKMSKARDGYFKQIATSMSKWFEDGSLNIKNGPQKSSKVSAKDTSPPAKATDEKQTNAMKCVVLAGTSKDLVEQFYDYLVTVLSTKGEANPFRRITAKTLLKVTDMTVNGSGKDHLAQVIKNPTVSNKMKGTKSVVEFEALQAYHEMAQKNPLRTTYGIGGVHFVAEQGAIQTLIVSDELLKTSTISMRAYISQLAQQLENSKVQVVVVNQDGLAATDIKNLSNIAAILRYPVYELETLDPAEIPAELRS